MTPLLEREGDLDAIRDGMADATGGDGRCIVIEGPAGIGKSALLGAARPMARDAGFRVISAVAGELEAEFPYGVVRQLFSPAIASPSEMDRLLVGAAALARPVLSLQTADDLASRS